MDPGSDTALVTGGLGFPRRGIAVRDWVAALAAARCVPVAVLPWREGARRDESLRVIGDPGLLRGLGIAPAPFDIDTPTREIMAPWRG